MRAAPAGLLARLSDTIVAIATAPGRGAVGVVRASGADLSPLIDQVCRRVLPHRQATLVPFMDGDGSVIDRGLAIHFPAPHSYTGEHVVELQAHGGPVVLQLLLARCLQALPGARVADPGEFTLRAYLNAKLDLAQAEAVADLIDAGTEAAARSASRSLSGAFSAAVESIAGGMVELRLLVEATLDFPEEEIDFLQQAGANRRLQALSQALQSLQSRARQGALLRDGLHVVLAGQPNVGKSSLLNALAGAELAIVTAIPGTTRDRIGQTIQIEGVPLHVVDTAGLRAPDSASDDIERIGISRSWQAIAEADVVLFLHDLIRLGTPDYDRAELDIADRLPPSVPVLHVYNKVDAAPGAGPPPTGLALSARLGTGIELLRQRLLEQAGWQPAAEGLFIARTRHLDALHRAGAHLHEAQALARQDDLALELLAEELRRAHDALGEITGKMDADALLGEIFGRFCIGK
jgi:tRNA modification GTPase